MAVNYLFAMEIEKNSLQSNVSIKTSCSFSYLAMWVKCHLLLTQNFCKKEFQGKSKTKIGW